MTGYSELLIRPLDSDHDKQGFHCGTASLDNYLQKQARQDVKRRVSQVFVVTATERPNSIVGYYTLSALSIELGQLPLAFARKLLRHPVSAALLGRLAVRQTVQRQGVGRMLLADAIKRTRAVSDEIAIYALLVDAMDDRAQCFYEPFGLSLLSSGTQRLFLPLKSVGTGRIQPVYEGGERNT